MLCARDTDVVPNGVGVCACMMCGLGWVCMVLRVAFMCVLCG